MHDRICFDVGDPERGYDINDGRFVRVVNEDPYNPNIGATCPDGKQYCLESQFDGMDYLGKPAARYTGELALKAKIKDGYKVDGQYTGDSYWLVGNEPDSPDQDAMNGSKVSGSTVLDSRDYAAMYAHLATMLANHDPDGDVWAAFCQATFPGEPPPWTPQTQYGQPADAPWGLDYCKEAYNHFLNMGGSPSDILAIGTHAYMDQMGLDVDIDDDGTVEAPAETFTTGVRLLTSDTLYQAIHGHNRQGEWPGGEGARSYIQQLQELENWTSNTTGLENVYLWLTEYGILKPWCADSEFYVTHVDAIDATGRGCDIDRLIDLNWDWQGNCNVGGYSKVEPRRDIFYGTDKTNGIYGMLWETTGYLSGNNRWAYAAPFVSRAPSYDVCNTGMVTREVAGIGHWMWGDDYAPEVGRANVSYAAELYNHVAACITEGTNCSTP